MTTNKPDLSTPEGRIEALCAWYRIFIEEEGSSSYFYLDPHTFQIKKNGSSGVFDNLRVFYNPSLNWQYYTEPKTPPTMDDILKADKVCWSCNHPEMDNTETVWEKSFSGWRWSMIYDLKVFLNDPFFRDTLGVTVEIVEGE